jgi:hypothetical protein
MVDEEMAETRMGLIRSIFERAFKGGGRRGPIRDADALADFLDRHAAFLSQSCITEFCRVRAGIHWQKLFDEREFQEKLSESCWKGYTPALTMLIEMTDATLRPSAGLRQRALPARLEKLGHSVMGRYPLPAGAPDNFWEEQKTLLSEHIAPLAGTVARPVREMAAPMARLIYKNLPLHKQIVRHDYDYIFNNLRMNLLRAYEDFEADADTAAIVDKLL